MLWQEGGGEPPKASLGWAIDTQFGSLEALIQKVNAEGAALQGSGWVVSFEASLRYFY
jgi:Fe-Mn family superoxide dismutase